MGVLAAYSALKLLLTRRQAKNRLAAAAARSSKTDRACFEQRDPVAPFCQMQRRGAAGNAAAEHRHVGPDFPAQGRPGYGGVAEGVVRRGWRQGQAHQVWAISV